jgi:hypothetical protein
MSMGELLFGKKEEAEKEVKTIPVLDTKALVAEIRKTGVLSVDLMRILTSLHGLGSAGWNAKTEQYTITANSSLTVEDVAPGRSYYIPIDFRIIPRADYALKFYFYIDDQVKYTDDSVLLATYEIPYKFLDHGAIFICRKIKYEFYNVTSSSVDLTILRTWISIDEDTEKKLKDYLMRVAEVIL